LFEHFKALQYLQTFQKKVILIHENEVRFHEKQNIFLNIEIVEEEYVWHSCQ